MAPQQVASAEQLGALTRAMDRYCDGDASAFAELYDALAPRLRAFFWRRTRDAGRSDDLVQTTFLQLHAGRRHFAPGADVLPWVYAIARRLLVDASRRGRREEAVDTWQPASGESPPDEEVDAWHQAARVEAELERIPPQQREAWRLIREEGLTVAQAAAVLGTTKTAVKLRTYRASKALRIALGLTNSEGLDG